MSKERQFRKDPEHHRACSRQQACADQSSKRGLGLVSVPLPQRHVLIRDLRFRSLLVGEIKPPARKLGQADHVFMVEALLDGESAEGIPVNVLFASGDSIEGVTDNTGTYGVNYGPEEFGRAFVKIE